MHPSKHDEHERREEMFSSLRLLSFFLQPVWDNCLLFFPVFYSFFVIICKAIMRREDIFNSRNVRD